MEWVSVDERLPDAPEVEPGFHESEPVLTYDKRGMMRVLRYTKLDDGDFWGNGELYLPPGQVTHWRPLPAPPPARR